MKRLNSVLILCLLCFGRGAYAKADFDWLVQHERYADVIGLSLMRQASPDCLIPCQAQALRNAGRASLGMGDYKGARLFLSRAEVVEPSLMNTALLAYLAVVQRDEPLAEKYGSAWERMQPGYGFKLIRAIDGQHPYGSQALDAVKEVAQATSDPQLREDLVAYRNQPYKSLPLAGALAVVPGLGFAYLGMWQSAATSLLLTGIGAWATADLWRHDMRGGASAAAAVTSVFYVGGILSSVRSAHDYNMKVSEPARRGIRGILLPQLKFEW